MNSKNLHFKNEIKKIMNYFNIAKYDIAIQKSKIILKKNPEFIPLFNIIGISLQKQKKNDEAIETFRKGLLVDPLSLDLRLNLANTYKAKRHFDTAEETGGAKTHTLSEANLAAHTHLTMNTGNGFGTNLENNTTGTGTTNSRGGLGNNDYIMQSVSSAANAGKTSSTGSGTAVTHMNPYIVTYMWKRTS